MIAQIVCAGRFNPPVNPGGAIVKAPKMTVPLNKYKMSGPRDTEASKIISHKMIAGHVMIPPP
jgi:hypothetical protein